jgi:hypothetical protein
MRKTPLLGSNNRCISQIHGSSPPSALKAELIFPEQSVALAGSYEIPFSYGSLILDGYRALFKKSPRGTDTDWQGGYCHRLLRFQNNVESAFSRVTWVPL